MSEPVDSCFDPLLCCFGFLSLSGCRTRVTQKMLFFPPEPPMYDMEPNRFVAVEHKQFGKVPFASLSDQDMTCEKIKTRVGTEICILFIPYKDGHDDGSDINTERLTLLFSHGNAADLGVMLPFLLMLVKKLHVNVCCYDYSGYGWSTGVPSPKSVLADGEAALNYIVETKKCTRIVLYGQSLGSAPTSWLASQKHTQVCGVVIHSGFASALRVLRPLLSTTAWYDIFPTMDWIKKSNVPVFVIHGTHDTGVSAGHGELVVQNSPIAYQPWFVIGAGHNDIEVHYRQAYYKKLRQFMLDLMSGNTDNFLHSRPGNMDMIVPPSVTM